MGKLFYHYTSIETFYKMLDESLKRSKESGELQLLVRATHCDFLNDQTEGKLFKQCLRRDLKACAEKQQHELTEEKIAIFDALYDVNDAFVISFSESGDSLDMWRAYGGNGKGVCLGFDFSPTEPWIDGDGIGHMSETIDVIKCQYFNPSLEIEESVVANVYDRLINTELDVVKKAGHLANGFRHGLTYKHVAYESEKEHRLIKSKLPYDTDIKFYEGTLKPYIDYPIDVKRLKRVVVGPCLNQDETKIKLTQILKYKGIYEVDVETSERPYRG